jgi:general stress protein 26
MTEDQRKKITVLLKANQFCVLATNSTTGTPESAVVAFSNTSDLEIVFASFKQTRKNKNLEKDPHISMVIGWDNLTTLQVEGTAEVVVGEERARLEDAHCLKNQLSNKYRNDPRQVYFKVRPRWIRYSNFSVDPQEVWEVDLK